MDGEDDPLTRKVIGAAFAVSKVLGHGFLEAVYKKALRIELVAAGSVVTTEKAFPVIYRGEDAGIYIADLLVDDRLIVEVKTVESLGVAHSAQLANYLKASGISAGLLINFGKPRVEVKRIVL